MKAALAPSQWVWVLVGDADIVKPQLEPLGLPITVLKPEEVLPPFKGADSGDLEQTKE